MLEAVSAPVIRHGTSRAYAIIAWLACAFFAASFVWEGGVAELLRLGAYPLLVAAVAWAVFWRPGVILDEESVTVINVVRSVRLPYRAITEITTRWGLSLRTAHREVTAFSAPTRSLRRRSRLASRQATKAADDTASGARGEALRPGQQRIYGDTDSLAAAIRQRCAEEPDTAAPTPPATTRPNTAELMVVGIAGVLAALSYLLS